jgi:hypothetical protein
MIDAWSAPEMIERLTKAVFVDWRPFLHEKLGPAMNADDGGTAVAIVAEQLRRDPAQCGRLLGSPDRGGRDIRRRAREISALLRTEIIAARRRRNAVLALLNPGTVSEHPPEKENPSDLVAIATALAEKERDDDNRLAAALALIAEKTSNDELADKIGEFVTARAAYDIAAKDAEPR